MKKTRKGFTLVELIIVIAVIGVLAAILIPVFSNVVEKANSKSAYSDQKNLISQLIVTIAEDRLGSSVPDTVLLTKKGGKVFAAIYAESLGGVVQLNKGEGFPGDMSNQDVLDQIETDGEIVSVPSPSETETHNTTLLARLNAQSTNGTGYQSLVEDLGYDSTETAITWGYTVGTIAQPQQGGLTGIAFEIDPVVLNVADNGTGTINVTTLSPSGTNVVWEIADGSSNIATVSGDNSSATVTGVAAGVVTVQATAGTGTDAVVRTCEVTVTHLALNGIGPDGYYYQNDARYTGSVTDPDDHNTYSFINGILVIGFDSKTYTQASPNAVVGSRTYNYSIPTSATAVERYLTIEVMINGDNSSYADTATYNITDATGKQYAVTSVTGVKPFGDLLDKDGWDADDVQDFLMNAEGRALLEANGYSITSANENLLTAYNGSTYTDPDRYNIYLPRLCSDSSLVQAYFNLTGCSNVADYNTKMANDTLMISLSDYIKVLYGKGYTMVNDGGTIRYNRAYGEEFTSTNKGTFYIHMSADPTSGCPIISLVHTGNGEYIYAVTAVSGDQLVFDHVLDADGSTSYTTSHDLDMLNFFLGSSGYKFTMSSDTVTMYKNSTEYCKFIIDNSTKKISLSINGTAMGTPSFVLPSSGTVALDANGRIPLTGDFDLSGVTVSAAALANLAGTSQSKNMIMEPALLEMIIKAAYSGMKVHSGSTNYNLNSINASTFTTTGSIMSATYELYLPDVSLLASNIFNGADYAGPSYVIMLRADNAAYFG